MKLMHFAVLTTVLLAACGGDDSSGGSSVGGPEVITNNLIVSNLSDVGFPWTRTAPGKLKRWDYSVSKIPVKLNGSTKAAKALDSIESVLGLTIFDRDSISGTANSDIVRGLIVSVGTALGPGGVVDSNTCGMVSGGIGETWYPANFYSSTGEINTRLYVHLDSSKCTASAEITVHEFGHALGLGAHFEGYGYGPAADGNFWNALYNLYHNEIGATADEIEIVQIRF